MMVTEHIKSSSHHSAQTMASTTLPLPYNSTPAHQILVPTDKTVGTAISPPPPPQSSLSSSPSHSSTSSFGSLSFQDCQSSPPATPLRSQGGGVPFSWEQIPGIPKESIAGDTSRHSSSLSLLPLPPCSADPVKNRPPSPKKLLSSSFRNDPFFAALVTCSKDDDRYAEKNGNIWKSGSKVTRSISDRFGFISFYASCKTTCAVSESIVYFPRSRNYDHQLLNRRERR
ncbi:uncharacterized protein LOC116002910 [Ipomoea triloba]|uniref:uncharacterized protein LOC116002910 n=1 Tax=Ipomoea triloba TaxID=35885 RepID=UPI00125E929D|nr:uncharacterized protein LOC116002910 [Ipomoea triloba]